jgi:hypothetical protein
VADIRIIGGGLPVLLGAASSFEVASVLEESMCMFAALKGAEQFQVMTSLGGCLRWVKFCSALPLSLKFRWFCQWHTASTSVLLGNYPPALFVALWLMVY